MKPLEEPPVEGAVLLDRKPIPELEAADIEYHAKIVAKLQEVSALEQKIGRVRAAAEEWSEHLADKYGLQEGDHVSNLGTITRGRAVSEMS